jgi:hypothetical protein
MEEGKTCELHCEPGDGLFEKSVQSNSLGGANVLSRMSYGKSALPSTTRELLSLRSGHDAIGFPILSLFKDLLGDILGFLDYKSLAILFVVSKNMSLVARSNEFWKALSVHYYSDSIEPGFSIQNWLLEFKYVREKVKRTRDYPRLFSQGLYGRLPSLVRMSTIESGGPAGHSLFDIPEVGIPHNSHE